MTYKSVTIWTIVVIVIAVTIGLLYSPPATPAEMSRGDLTEQIDQLKAAAEICQKHTLPPVNGVQPDYPRWPNAWKDCEIVWRVYLDLQTIDKQNAEEEHGVVLDEADRLKGH